MRIRASSGLEFTQVCVKEGDIMFALGFLSLQIAMMTKEFCVDCRNPSLQTRFEVQ